MPTAADVIASEDAPAAIGPYSQAVRAGDLVLCSGQIPLDPATGELVDGGVAAQATRCMENLAAVAAAAGGSLADAVRFTIYTTDLGEFAAINEAYGAFLGDDAPARAAVGVAALPRGARVEIDAILHLPEVG